MAINAAFASVTLASGVGTGTWKHPEQVLSGSPDTVELDAAPQFFMLASTANTLLAAGIVKVESSTTQQVRLVSTHNSDSSTWLVIGFVKLPEWLWRSPA